MDAQLISGGSHSDARGILRFCNDFDMSTVRHFYTISNSVEHPRRGWIMHKRETKWFFPLFGVTVIYVERDGRARTQRFILSANDSAVLRIPPNHWICIEQDGAAEVQVFSNCRIGEFPDDDYRRPL